MCFFVLYFFWLIVAFVLCPYFFLSSVHPTTPRNFRLSCCRVRLIVTSSFFASYVVIFALRVQGPSLFEVRVQGPSPFEVQVRGPSLFEVRVRGPSSRSKSKVQVRQGPSLFPSPKSLSESESCPSLSPRLCPLLVRQSVGCRLV